MTIHQLINRLELIGDKTLPVYVLGGPRAYEIISMRVEQADQFDPTSDDDPKPTRLTLV
jgi:hypothetical protein